MKKKLFANKKGDIEDFIPIATHYDHNTLLSKNGDLIQIIRISGIEKNLADFGVTDIRQSVRKSVLKHVQSKHYLISFHIIRDRDSIKKFQTNKQGGLCAKVNEAWEQINHWQQKFNNLLYITITKKNNKPFSFLKSFFPKLLYKDEKKFCAIAVKKLSNITQNIKSDLDRFTAEILSIKKEQDYYISEPLSFYYYLINFRAKQIAVPVLNYAKFLADTNIEVFNNYIKIGQGADTRYAAIYSFKQVQDINNNYSDLLHISSQFIITENIYFSHSESEINKVKKIRDIQDIGLADKEYHVLASYSNIIKLMSMGDANSNSYCMQQITMTIISDEWEFFVQKNRLFNDIIESIGIVGVREDYGMSKLYWSTLPGNAKFLGRARYNASCNIGLLNDINDLAEGCYIGSKWGIPITLFRTISGKIFYFNFHHLKNANTIIIGPKDTGKTTLSHFLLANSLTLQPKIIYIDTLGKAGKFIESIGGNCIDIKTSEISPLSFDLLNLEYFNNDIKIFSYWLRNILFNKHSNEQKFVEFCDMVAKKIFVSDIGSAQRYQILREIIESAEDKVLLKNFESSLGSDIFDNFFKEDVSETLGIEDHVGLNLKDVQQSPIFATLLPLILMQIVKKLDGKPTIVVIPAVEPIFDSYMALFFDQWLADLSNNNAMALICATDLDILHKDKNFIKSTSQIVTRIFMSDIYADSGFKKSFGLTNKELHNIKNYDTKRRIFLLKQHNSSILTTFNLEQSPAILEKLL